jgi:hypothetical protein
MNKYILILLLLSFTIASCSSQDCKDLPSQFSSFSQAVNKVKSANFTIKEKVKTTKSSWIKSISFYSCNSEKGFLLVETQSEEYIYQNVPISVWEQFKEADSFGTFYNKFIKENYLLKLI